MKKTQVKFGETIAVMIVVSIIIFLGLAWYQNINTNDLKEIREKDANLRAFEKYNYIINLDILHQSENSVIDNDLSLASLKAFEKFLEKEENFEIISRNLGKNLITISIFNETFLEGNKKPFEKIILYNNSLDEETLRSSLSFLSPISIIDIGNNRKYFAILEMYVQIEK
jgi:hypothetical protein